MKFSLKKLLSVLVTLAMLGAAFWVGRQIWNYYQDAPWTPDGRVRADIVQIAADVSGLVKKVHVVNDQRVHKGEVLFELDDARLLIAQQEAKAEVAAQQARLAQWQREAARNRALGELVAAEIREQGEARVQEARAALERAVAAQNLATLNVQRARVLAPVDGVLSDLTLRQGNYVAAGKPVMALIDSSSFRVEGYFEETKLRHIQPGQVAEIQLMGADHLLKGKVGSIAAGIEDRDRSSGTNLLPNVNPTFSWVRLAQRIPVRIELDDVSDPILVAGRTATVSLLTRPEGGAR